MKVKFGESFRKVLWPQNWSRARRISARYSNIGTKVTSQGLNVPLFVRILSLYYYFINFLSCSGVFQFCGVIFIKVELYVYIYYLERYDTSGLLNLMSTSWGY